MIGRKTLAEVREELEAALGRQLAGTKPPGDVEDSPGRVAVWESLRGLLARARADADSGASTPAVPTNAGSSSGPGSKGRRRKRAAG
jgi:hypothetical protein